MSHESRRPFLAMAVIWASLLVALLAVGPQALGFAWDQASALQPTTTEAVDQGKSEALQQAEARAEARRQARTVAQQVDTEPRTYQLRSGPHEGWGQGLAAGDR